MRILLLNQTFYPDLMATSQQVTDLAVFLAKQQHQVTVITGRRGYEERQKKYPHRETWQGIKIRRVNSTGFGKTSTLKRIIDSITFDLMLLWELFWTSKQDVVVSFTSPPMLGVFGTFFTLLKGGRNVQWLMDINPDAAFAVGYADPNALSGKVLKKILSFTLEKSDHVVVLDRWMRGKAMENGARAETVSIIPPWSVLDDMIESVGSSTGEFRKKHSLESKFFVLYSGNHSIAHPLHTLLQAALRLKADPSISFVFAGSGLRAREVMEFKERHQLVNILQLPWQPREMLKDSFLSADLHVVVMGNNMSGIIHTSKLYSVLASGRPYLFIGPENSHVGDLLAEIPTGKHANHGDVESVIRAIHETKDLSLEARTKIQRENTQYLKTHYGRELSLGTFVDEVLNESQPQTLAPKKALSASN